MLLSESVYDPMDAMLLLLHDASEAYLMDVPSPIKPFIPDYHRYEKRLQTTIMESLGYPTEFPERLKEMDRAILLDEQTQNMSPSVEKWQVGTDIELDVTIECLKPERARSRFIQTFNHLEKLLGRKNEV